MKRGSFAAAGLLLFVFVVAAIRTATPFPARNHANRSLAPRRPQDPARGTALPMSVQASNESGDLVPRESMNDNSGAELDDPYEVRVKIAHLLELAFMVFDQGKYEKCGKLCDEILTISPEYCVALELRDDAAKAAVLPEYAPYLRKKFEDWKSLTSEEEATIPYSQGLRFPTRASWGNVSPRISGPIIRSKEMPARITLAGTDLDLDQWISILAAAGVSVRLEERPDRSDRVTLHTGEISVEEALDLLAVLFGLTWDREDGSGIVLRRSPP